MNKLSTHDVYKLIPPKILFNPYGITMEVREVDILDESISHKLIVSYRNYYHLTRILYNDEQLNIHVIKKAYLDMVKYIIENDNIELSKLDHYISSLLTGEIKLQYERSFFEKDYLEE